MSEIERKIVKTHLLICAGILFAAVLLLGANWFSSERKNQSDRVRSVQICRTVAESFIGVIPESGRPDFRKAAESSPELILRMNCTELRNFRE